MTMAWFSRFVKTSPLVDDIIQPDPAPIIMVGINAEAWRESAIRGLEKANQRFDALNNEIQRVEQAHMEHVAHLTGLKDQEVNRLKAHREGTRQVIEAARAALGTFPTVAPSMPAPDDRFHVNLGRKARHDGHEFTIIRETVDFYYAADGNQHFKEKCELIGYNQGHDEMADAVSAAITELETGRGPPLVQPAVPDSWTPPVAAIPAQQPPESQVNFAVAWPTPTPEAVRNGNGRRRGK